MAVSAGSYTIGSPHGRFDRPDGGQDWVTGRGPGRIAAPSARRVKARWRAGMANSRPRKRPAVLTSCWWMGWLGLCCDRDGEDLVAAAQLVQIRAGFGQEPQLVREGR